ncbi:MAG: anthranilate phosphoribosyltransferase, partial [Lachnospiraceae bacterium]
MIKDAIVKLRDRKNLTFEESRACVDEIMSGQTSPVQTTAFLTALAMK